MIITDELKPYLLDGYLPAIGIECHAQLATVTKLFTAVANQFDPEPNQLIGPLCLGLPGTLPVLNRRAVELAIRAGLALEGEIAGETHFDRKHYFYPDLPLGYQISQHQRPIIRGGHLSFWSQQQQRSVTVELHQAHLEADAGKLNHPPGADYSLVDYNRAGAPLLEIVSQPMIHSPADAKDYLRELYRRLVYAGVSEGNLFQGHLRFDVNVSLARPGAELGMRAELKNLNSFRFVEQALKFELARQLARLRSGQPVIQETRGWDENKRQTFSQRSKEEAPDYRYMPDPDLPPVVIDSELIETIRAELPLLPPAIRQALDKVELPSNLQDTLLDWPPVATWLAGVAGQWSPATIKIVANWLVGDLWRLVKDGQLGWDRVLAAEADLQQLATAVADRQVSAARAKEFLALYWSGASLAEFLAGADQSADTDSWRAVVAEVAQDHPQVVADARVEAKAAGFLVGQVRRRLPEADPGTLRRLIDEYLQTTGD